MTVFEAIDHKGSSYVYSSDGMRIILPEEIQAKIGQTVKIDGKVSRDKGIVPSLYTNEIRLMKQSINVFKEETNSGILLFASIYEKMVKTRGKMVNFLHFSLPEPHSSIAAGMLLGERQQFDADEKDRLQTVGLMHVVAASGSNVVMVSSLLEGILRKKRGLLPLACLLLCIWMYTAFAHFSPTIVRASLMATMQTVSRSCGREYIGLWALLLSGLLMLVFDPFLLFALSFQLSMLASFAMCEIYPLLLKIFAHESFGALWQAAESTLLSSLAVTLVSAPLLIYQFGSYSLISFLSNVAMLWIVPYIMGFAFLAVLAEWLLPTFSSILVIPAWMVCDLWVRLVSFFSMVPFASVQLPSKLGPLLVIPSGYAVFMIYRRSKYVL